MAAILPALVEASQRGRARKRSTAAASAGELLTIRHAGIDRRYHVHVPSPARPGPIPLVVVLHGGGTGDSADHVELIRNASRFDAKADREGFLVAYPEAVDGHWNDGRGLPRYVSQRDNVDDLGFIAAVVEDIAARRRIDRARVFVTGASNGAMMTYRIACERPGAFAAAAAVIGNLPTALNCAKPAHATPIVIINGTEDPLMPWAGGDVRFGPQRLGEVRSGEATLRHFADVNGCSPTPSTETLPDRAPGDRTRVFRVSFSGCRAAVVMYRIEGGGHAWPGGPGVTAGIIVGRTSRDIDATDEIWAFFSTHMATLR